MLQEKSICECKGWTMLSEKDEVSTRWVKYFVAEDDEVMIVSVTGEKSQCTGRVKQCTHQGRGATRWMALFEE